MKYISIMMVPWMWRRAIDTSKRNWDFRLWKCIQGSGNPWEGRVLIDHTISSFRRRLRLISSWGTIILGPLCHVDGRRRDEFDDSTDITVECQGRGRNEFSSDLLALKRAGFAVLLERRPSATETYSLSAINPLLCKEINLETLLLFFKNYFCCFLNRKLDCRLVRGIRFMYNVKKVLFWICHSYNRFKKDIWQS